MSTQQLLSAAMTLTQQGVSPYAGQTEGVASWAVRTVPADSVRDSAPRSEAIPAAIEASPPSPVGGQPVDAPMSAPVNPPAAPAADQPAGRTEGQPQVPADPPPASGPNSDIRWLLPEDDLQQWMPVSQPRTVQPVAQSGVIGGLKQAVSKLGQWLGWGQVPSAPAVQSQPDSAASADSADPPPG